MKRENSALKEACLNFGGQASIARRLGVSPPTVNQWISGARPIPAERCLEIEKITEGTVTCEELRPDVDWAYLRGTLPQLVSQKPTAPAA
ncbi:TPA: transcriptional regulator [Yersinia enterocolitica]